MLLEQAIIRSDRVEVPVLALREPLLWVVVGLAFILGVMWLRKR